MTPLHVIKCYESAEEDDWNRFLLAPLGIVELRSPDFSIVEDRSIFLMIGTRGLGHVPESFWERLGRVKGKGLYHLGDEYLAGGYEHYRHFDFVIRNHWAKGLDRAGVRTVPLGYPRDMAGDEDRIEVSKRPLVWSFLGHRNSARAGMSAEFQRLEPHHLYFTNLGIGHGKISRQEYRETLRASAFVPCPMGNAMLETWRLYEALEAGAIPLLNRRLLMRYHESVMPGNPIPTFANWPAARRYVEGLRADPSRMDAVQHQIGLWWDAYKSELQAELCDFVQQGLDGAFRSSLAAWRPGTGLRLQAWRVFELLKHHDFTAVKGRCATMASRFAGKAGLLSDTAARRTTERKIS